VTPKRQEAPQRAVGYVRVSTETQAVDGISLEAQRARIEAWCIANGYELVGLHMDAGISGKRADNRPGLQAALIEVSRTRGSALVVYSLSRLARSVKDTLEIAGRLDRIGADLVSLSEKIDTTSAAGRMVFRMLAVLAEFERDLCGERTKAALSLKKQRGECVGEVPLGWRRQGDRLVDDEAGQRVVALIRHLRAQGMTLRAIAAELERVGALRAKGGTRWDPKTVLRILARENDPPGTRPTRGVFRKGAN
jgi:site-specific DNA recombinase